MKTPPHILALKRLTELINRYEALPYRIVEHNSEAMIEWDENLDNTYHAIKESEKVTTGQLENIRMSEQAMDGWERTAQAGKEIDEMAKKQTEKDYALAYILEKAGGKVDDLAKRAVDNVDETGQSASFSVKVKLEPTGEGKEIKTVTTGKITLSTAQETEHMSLSNQVRMGTGED